MEYADINSLSKRYDTQAKVLLSYRYILAWILKGYVPEYVNEQIEDIANKYIASEPQVSSAPVHQNERIVGSNTEDSTLDEGTVLYDIRFEACVPNTDENIRVIINIEAQNKPNPGYDLWKRAAYYCSRLVSAQKGTVFEKSEYSKIRKVYSIWLLPNVTQALENTITSYQFHETQILGNYHRNKESYDIMQFIIVGLGEKAEQEPYGAQRLLSVLLAQGTTRREKADIFGEYDIPINSKSEEAMNDMCNLSQGLVETGITKGRAEGAAETKKEIIKNLMASGNFTPDSIAAIVNLPLEEVHVIIAEISSESDQ